MNEKRGVSLGTVFMLCVTVAVLIGSAVILPELMGSPNGEFHLNQVLEAVDLSGRPELGLADIPLGTAAPTQALTDAPDRNVAPTAAPTTAPTSSPTPKVGGTFTFVAGGAITIGDSIRQSAYYSESKKYDFSDIFSFLEDEMDADLTLVTLKNLIQPSKKVSSLNAPPAVADFLARAGVNMVNIGFPKAYNSGAEGLRTTAEALQGASLTTLGAYPTQEDASLLRLMTLQEVPVAFLHYTDDVPKSVARDGAEYALPVAEASRIAADIASARNQGAAVVVVSLYWGKDNATKPTKAQRNLAQALADAGADVILGVGTVKTLPIEWLTGRDADGAAKQTLCVWSLGTLLSEDRSNAGVAGMLLQLRITWDGQRVSFGQVQCVPTYVWRWKQGSNYQYRVVLSDAEPPDGMSDEQRGAMERALKNLRTTLEDSPVQVRSN